MRAVLLVFFLGVTRTVLGDCPKPTGGPNTVLTSELTYPAPEGTSANFACEVGYKKIRGYDTAVCSGGQWAALNLECEIRTCGPTDEVLNGYVDFAEGTDFGAVARVVCDHGFQVVGYENSIYCGVQGWQGRLPECEVIKCDPPNPIANGQFSPQNDEYDYSSVITYSCDGEYKLNGSSTASCETDRQFKPAPPKCVLVNCPEPKVDLGVAVSGSRPPYKHQNSVTFKCNIGHQLFGQDTVSCDINGEWSPKLPKCNPIECKAPVIANSEVTGGSRPTYKFDETVTLKCLKGYKLSGKETLKCGEGSRWSAAFPECTMIQCQTPVVQGGVLVGEPRPSYIYLDKVTFECISGHDLSGESTLTCDENSQWSPKLPRCTPVVCRTPEVTNGQVVEGARPSYKYLDSVMFECQSGYKMSGQSNLTCALNRQWSPALPQCTQSNGNVLPGVLGGLAVCLATGTAVGVYCGVVRKKKGKLGRPVAPA